MRVVLGIITVLQAVQALWPIPTHMTTGKSNTSMYNAAISYTGDSLILKRAVNRYAALINNEKFTAPANYKQGVIQTPGVFDVLSIKVKSSNETLDFGIDESYTLDIPESGNGELFAKTVYGAIRGLETFSQLVSANGPGKVIKGTPIHISDKPFFRHRGILLDTSRNFYSLKSILRTLDAMSYNKLNTFHWHVVDSQSWPIESKVYPKLHEMGAYSPEMIYSYRDIATVIDYARDRGIRVIPEFDFPGHTYIVGEAYPELMSCLNMQPNWDKYAAEPPSGQLNIAKDETIKFTNNLVKEYSKLFPDNFFHIGGDEVNRECWKQDPDVNEYIKENPGEDVESLLASWFDKIHDNLAGLGKDPISWEETLFHSNYTPPKNTVIQTWIDKESIPKTVAAGYRSIASPASAYYLDCGHGAWLSTLDGNSWCDPYKTWMHIYNFDPHDNIASQKEKDLVIGVEVALWSEQSDETTLDKYLWPRASAMAETGWSGKKDENGHVRTTGEVASRLHEHRFRLLGRGIHAEPMQPLWCARNPGQCNFPGSS